MSPSGEGERCLCSAYLDPGEDTDCDQNHGEDGGCVPGPRGGCRLCTRTVGRMQAVYQDRGVDVDSAVYQDHGEDAGCVSGPWGRCVTSPPSHGLGTEERKAAGLTASGQPGQSWVGLSSPWTSHFSFLDLSFIPVN